MANPITPIGRMDRLVTLQLRSVAREATMGGETVAWLDLATVWAEVVESAMPATANDPATASVQLYARPIRLRIRWRQGLSKSGTRVVFEGRVLRIIGLAEIGRRLRIELACEEWANEPQPAA